MSKVIWKSLLLSPTFVAIGLLGNGSAFAAQPVEEAPAIQVSDNKIAQSNPFGAPTNEQPAAAPANNQPAAAPVDNNQAPVNTQNMDQMLRYSNEGNQNTEAQVTNVSQFSDVQSTDWAYEALSRVVEKYGCLQGYPDGTYRGKRALSRYEFAAGLNACLRQIEALIEAKGQNYVTKDDFEALQRLVEEFRTELATLGGRVDNLEARTTFLEEHQFSTTTKLAGEAIFAYTDTLDNKGSPGILGNRVRLDLRTSFTGKDVLHTRLAAGNLSNPLGSYYGFDTREGGQTFELSPGENNDIKLDWLGYYGQLNDNVKFYIAATGGIHSDYVNTNNPYFEDYDGGNGALSNFASESPIYRIGGGAGVGLKFKLGPAGISLGYLAENANNPDGTGGNNGFVNGEYAALAQVDFDLNDKFGLGLTYVRGRHVDGEIYDLGSGTGVVGTAQANALPNAVGGVNTNSYGLTASFRPSKKLSFSGFVMKTDSKGDDALGNEVKGDTWSYGAGIALPNLGKEGNVLGLFAGVSPTLRGLRVAGNQAPITRDNAYHVEAFYKYQLTDNISVTPGVIWLSNPEQDSSNDSAVIGTLRTTFTF
jgi:BMFP domain-containing protein YqiC